MFSELLIDLKEHDPCSKRAHVTKLSVGCLSLRDKSFFCVLSVALPLCPVLRGEDAFTSRVLHILLKNVKFGETVSYKRLAEMAGNPKAVRAVGGAMRKNPVSVADID